MGSQQTNQKAIDRIEPEHALRPKARKRRASPARNGRSGSNQVASDLVRVALDELNLATFPISVLDKKAQSSREPLVFQDTINYNGERIERLWKVFPHPEKGFPGPIDDDVLMALLEMTREQGGAKKVYFSRYDLLKRLGWSINATYYQRLETSFKKLAAVRVEAINAFGGDRNRKRFVNMGLTFIQEWKLNAETRGGERSSYVLWSDRIAASIHQELTRYLDATFYFEELRSPIERRFFRYLDNNFDGKSLMLTLNVRDLAHEHLGVSRQYKYVSQLMQRLEPALDLFVEKGYLENWLLSGESLILNKHEAFVSRVQLALPFLSASQPVPVNDPEAVTLERMLEERGVAASVASRLASNQDVEQRGRVRAAIDYFDAERGAGKQFANPGGFLVSLVAKGVPSRAKPARTTSRTRVPAGDVTVEATGSEIPADELELEMAYQTYLNDVGMRRYAALVDEDCAALIDGKRRDLLASAHKHTFERMPTEAFDEHVRYMVRKDLASEYADTFESWSQTWRNRRRKRAV